MDRPDFNFGPARSTGGDGSNEQNRDVESENPFSVASATKQNTNESIFDMNPSQGSLAQSFAQTESLVNAPISRALKFDESNDLPMDSSDTQGASDSFDPNSHYSNDNKYKCWFTPSDAKERANLCLKLFPNGVLFCTRQNCNYVKQHPTDMKIQIEANQCFILKTDKKAFIFPKASAAKVDNEVKKTWDSAKKTLIEWRNEFSATALLLGEENKVKSVEALKDTKIWIQRQTKTPSKKRVLDSIRTEIEPYQSKFIKAATDIPEVNEVLEGLDESLEKNEVEHQIMLDNQANLAEAINQSNLAFDHQIREIKDSLGEKPVTFSEKHDAPSVWGTVNSIITTIEEGLALKYSKEELIRLEEKLQKEIECMASTLEQRAALIEGTLERKIKEGISRGDTQLNTAYNQLRQSTLEVDSYVKAMVENLNSAFKSIHKRLDDLETQNPQTSKAITVNTRPTMNFDQNYSKQSQKLSSAQTQPSNTGSGTGGSNGQPNPFLQTLLDEVYKIKARVEGKEKPVKFNGFNFNSKEDSDAWMETHNKEGRFGLLVDFHCAMEHIHQKMNSFDPLARLKRIKELNVTNNSEAIQIISYQSQVPLFFDNGKDDNVLEQTDSLFSNIKTWEDWDKPIFGYRAKWNTYLNKWKDSHQKSLLMQFSHDLSHPYYRAALVSITEVYAFCIAFIQYIDTTYKRYADSKFGTEKAWHVTTKLATSLILVMEVPRAAVMNTLGSNQLLNAKNIFYSTLLALDIMNDILAKRFSDHPAVRGELLEFLTLNTTVEEVSLLELRVTELEEDKKTLLKELKGAVTKADTASNKVQELQKDLKALTKEVNVLKNKK